MWSTHRVLYSTHGSMHLLSGSATTQDLPRILYWVLCFELTMGERQGKGREGEGRIKAGRASKGRVRSRKYHQVYHICPFPLARTLSQGSNLIVKFRHEVLLCIQKHLDNLCHTLHSYKHNSVDSECLPSGPSLALQCNTHRTTGRYTSVEAGRLRVESQF